MKLVKKQTSENEALLALQLRAFGIGFETQYRFAAVASGGTGNGVRHRLQQAKLQDWRFDFAFISDRLAVEVEGGGWTYGRHNRPKGFHDDLLKYEAAIKLGWTLYRCDGEMVKSGRALNTIIYLLDNPT